MAFLDLGVQLRHALVVERYFSAHQNVEHNPETPYIDLWAGVLLGLQQFWGCEIQAAAECFQQISGREQVAQAKINDFDVASLADEDVLNFQVPVNDAVTVTVVQGAGDLTSKLASLFLLEATVRDDVV